MTTTTSLTKPPMKRPLLANKRPRLGTPFTTPTRKVLGAATTTTGPSPTLQVHVDPRHGYDLNLIAVGSLVMILGEVFRLNQQEELQQAENDDNPYILQARTVQLVNETDMSMHVHALTTRRKFIFERYGHCGDNTALLQGCGPPPYDNLKTL